MAAFRPGQAVVCIRDKWLREKSELAYHVAGFSQIGWGAGPRDDLEEVCKDEGAQCGDEGAQWAR